MTDQTDSDDSALLASDGDYAADLFLNASGLVPLFTTQTGHQHEQVTSSFDALRENRLPYRPLVTNHYVLDDEAFSLTDHVVAVQATEHDISHVLTYDDDFRALGFSVIPRV